MKFTRLCRVCGVVYPFMGQTADDAPPCPSCGHRPPPAEPDPPPPKSDDTPTDLFPPEGR